MIKISKLADYAVVVLGAMDSAGIKLLSASQIAAQTNLPEPTVAKVLKALAGGEVVLSVRGVQGGYRLARAPQDIDIASVIMAVDGPVSLTACVEGSTDSCSYAVTCPVNGRWNAVNDAVRFALQSITLADMIAPKNCGTIEKQINEEARV